MRDFLRPKNLWMLALHLVRIGYNFVAKKGVMMKRLVDPSPAEALDCLALA